MKKIIHTVLSSSIIVLGLSLPVTQADDVNPGHSQQASLNNEVVAPAFVRAAQILEHAKPRHLYLHSGNAFILDQREGVTLYEKAADDVRPIASISKLMTAMVTLDATLPMDEEIKILRADRDWLRGSRSRLPYGTVLSRGDLLLITLAASENRASKALARTYPGGHEAFIEMMNIKARELGMTRTEFHDASGLHSGNVSTPRDLAKLVNAAFKYPLIQSYTTRGEGFVTNERNGRRIEFRNTNKLVRRNNWDIGLSKTGYIADAGHCLVMQMEVGERPVVLVLLNSWGKLSKFGDSYRAKKWLERAERKAKHVAAPKQVAG